MNDIINLKNNMRGHVKVELFEKNKKVRKEEGYNRLTEHQRKSFLENARNKFSDGIMNKVNTNIYQDSTKVLTLLNTFEQNGDISKNFDFGDVIGYSYKDNYSGSNVLRGNLNIAESSHIENTIKYVFDFPTHVSNGLINTIIFNNNENNGIPINNFTNTRRKWTKNTNNIFSISSNGWLAEYDNNMVETGRSSRRFRNPLYISATENFLYVFYSGTMEIIELSTFSHIRSISRNDSILGIISDSRYTEINNGQFFIRNLNDDTIIKTININYNPDPFAFDNFLFSDNEKSFFSNNNTKKIVCIDHSTAIITNNFISTNLQNLTYYNKKIRVNTPEFNELSNQIATIFRLPNSIIKNNTQTMKITYTITIPN